MSLGRLAGKRAIVTGGGSGIGRAICELFAKEGASVAVMDIDGSKASETVNMLESKNSSSHCFISGNIAKSDDIKRTLIEAHENFGCNPNLLINNAGITRGGLIDTLSEEDIDDVLNVNLRGAFLMAKYFIASVKESNDDIRGTIVNVSSMAGLAGFGMNSEYSAAKAGVIGLSKSIALEYPWHKVRCNALLPGFTDTPMVEQGDSRLLKKMLNDVITLKRLARPEEMAYACLFLASDESSYVHGACLEVSGGLR